jgi:DNA-binding NarL/FixJ family response regulator
MREAAFPSRLVLTLPTFIVEDNAMIFMNLEQTLTELAGVQVIGHAAGEQEAIDWLLDHPDQWRLAIVDLFLREGNGLGVLAACRARGLGQRVVVLSNYATEDMRARCIDDFDADAVFDKSTEIDALLDYCLKQHAAS